MSKLDIVVIALVLLPAIFGLFKGLVNVAITFLGIWGAFVVAGLFADDVVGWLAPTLGEGPLTAALAYAVVFVAVVLLAGLVGWLVTRSLKALDLQWANRLAGGAIGLCCGVLLACVLVVTWASVAPESRALEKSPLAGPLSTLGGVLVALPERLDDATQALRPVEASANDDAPVAPVGADAND